MPYVDKQKQLEYQNAWIKKRRLDWLEANGPCKQCGSWEDLEVDHITPEDKIEHKVWSWSEKRRLEELAKCQVLCYECHKKKTKLMFPERQHGTRAMYDRGKCRCLLCKAVNAKIRREWRARIGRH